MKTFITILIVSTFIFTTNATAQIDVSKHIPGIDYASNYSFNKCNRMEIQYFTKKGKPRMTMPYKIFYSDDFEVIDIWFQRGSMISQTLIDFPANNLLIIYGEGNNISGSAAAMKDREKKKFKKLPLEKTDETKDILGHKCNKYTMKTDEFTGEIWATKSINHLPNKTGIWKASKTEMYYQTIPDIGFIMEITSFNPKGQKTVMKTLELEAETNYGVNIPEEFGIAINKVDYYKY